MASPPSIACDPVADPGPPTAVIFGRGSAMEAVRRKLDKVASANVPVLIDGESGTGKEIVAGYLHQQSFRRGGPFVKVNCPAIPGNLLETEMFGYESGAFTGATEAKPGRVELAERGTLFLDEIAELDPALQPKLLHLLQDGQFFRIGGADRRRVEARIVCATNRDLLEEVAVGNFRRDLYYRINVLNVHLPPLRERREDLPSLIEYFLDLYNRQFGCQARPLSPPVNRLLESYTWPGNIRELENLIKRYVILDSEEIIAGELLTTRAQQEEPGGDFPLDGSVSLKELTRHASQQLERKIILRALQASHWNRKRTARVLHISYRALLYKIKEAGVPPKRLARPAAVAAEPRAWAEEPDHG
ncbi:MAG: sigma-54 interaction domain-containing protein [Terriglobales bacterium]